MPDAHRPVAAIIDEDSTVTWVTWPDAPLPDRSIGGVRLWATPKGAWVFYETDDSDEPRNVVERLAVHLTPGGVTAACSIGEGRPSASTLTACGSETRGTHPCGWRIPIPSAELNRDRHDRHRRQTSYE